MTELLKERILDGIEDTYLNEAMNYRKKGLISTVGKVAACIAIIMGLSCSSLFIAVAAGNMTAYDVLYTIYPDIAEKLMPVNVCCEDEGIRMEVEGVSIQDDCAYIYISMQDLEGTRIDESIDLFDSYSIHTNADQIGNCTLVDFDEENAKATFLITVQHMNGAPMEGRVMQFSVSQFLSGKSELQEELTQISLDSISEVDETQTEDNLSIRGETDADGTVSEGMAQEYLCVDNSKSFVPTAGVTVTNYGLIHNKLHVQVYYEDILQFDNHGSIYLLDADGNTVYPKRTIAFWDEEKNGSYEEYIFDIGANSLEEYAIYGDFVTCQNLVKGDWEVQFRIENQ